VQSIAQRDCGRLQTFDFTKPKPSRELKRGKLIKVVATTNNRRQSSLEVVVEATENPQAISPEWDLAPEILGKSSSRRLEIHFRSRQISLRAPPIRRAESLPVDDPALASTWGELMKEKRVESSISLNTFSV
jgi:hypothetical protein